MSVSPYLRLAAALALGAQITAAPWAALAQRTAIVQLPSIRSLYMMTPTAGWALEASAVLHTTDSGSAWENVSPAGLTIARTSVAFALDARTAWVTATRTDPQAPFVVHTADGGHTWHAYALPPIDAAAGIAQISFTDAQHGWLLVSLGAGAGSEPVQILSTGDGGAHWTTVSRTTNADPAHSGLPRSGIKTGISFRDATIGWATASVAGPDNFSWLYMTRDAGHTWQHQGLIFPTPYRQVLPVLYPPRFFTPRDGVLPAFLYTPTMIPAIDFYRTHDGGATWSSTTPLPFTTTTGSPSWDLGDLQHGWAVWGTQLHVTKDGGLHWSAFAPNVGLQNVTQLDFVNAQDGWALGAATVTRCVGECLSGRGPLGGSLLRTVDGGRTWRRPAAYVTYPA